MVEPAVAVAAAVAAAVVPVLDQPCCQLVVPYDVAYRFRDLRVLVDDEARGVADEDLCRWRISCQVKRTIRPDGRCYPRRWRKKVAIESSEFQLVVG